MKLFQAFHGIRFMEIIFWTISRSMFVNILFQKHIDHWIARLVFPLFWDIMSGKGFEEVHHYLL